MMNNMNPGRRLLIGVALLSVMLNLFLIGMLAAGLGMKHHRFGPLALSAPHGAYMAEWLTHYLSPADADLFRASFQSQAEALKTAHEHVRQATKDVAAIFEQATPDPQALQTALDHLSQAKAETNDAVEKMVQDLYPKLSPEGRHRLAELTP